MHSLSPRQYNQNRSGHSLWSKFVCFVWYKKIWLWHKFWHSALLYSPFTTLFFPDVYCWCAHFQVDATNVKDDFPIVSLTVFPLKFSRRTTHTHTYVCSRPRLLRNEKQIGAETIPVLLQPVAHSHPLLFQSFAPAVSGFHLIVSSSVFLLSQRRCITSCHCWERNCHQECYLWRCCLSLVTFCLHFTQFYSTSAFQSKRG